MNDATKSTEVLDGVQRAAILMMTLGQKDAGEIMRLLPPKQVQKLGISMATIKGVARPQINTVLSEFHDIAADETGIGLDSDEYIKDVLVNALGEERATNIVDRILLGANAKGLETLKWMDPRSIMELIRFEHPQIQAIVLSYLDPDQAAEVLGMLDEVIRLDLTMRIATLEFVQPKALQELNEIMEKQFHSGKGGQAAVIGGLKTAANIMNYLDSTVETQLLEQIKEQDQDLGQNIQDMMFVFDNLSELDDRDIQALLREISSENLLLALKGSDAIVKDKIFSNMSKRAVELMLDDLEAKGPVKLKDVETAQKDILSVARRMADAGEIALGGKGGEEMI